MYCSYILEEVLVCLHVIFPPVDPHRWFRWQVTAQLKKWMFGTGQIRELNAARSHHHFLDRQLEGIMFRIDNLKKHLGTGGFGKRRQSTQHSSRDRPPDSISLRGELIRMADVGRGEIVIPCGNDYQSLANTWLYSPLGALLSTKQPWLECCESCRSWTTEVISSL